jgi:spore coat protein CotH
MLNRRETMFTQRRLFCAVSLFKESAINTNSSLKVFGKSVLPSPYYIRLAILFCLILFFGCSEPGLEDALPVSYRDTGLPVIYIETKEMAPIDSRETWVNMTIKVVSDNSIHSFEKTTGNDQIRGRGNNTWSYPKKPYRIRFREDTSMFGLTASRNWVLLANYKDATMLANTIAFELGQRFDGPLFKNNYIHVELVLNGEYKGSYLLTEHMRVGQGRVEIDPVTDYLAELDTYYDEDPKFRTANLNLPVMISSPDFGLDINDTRYQFVIDSLNKLDAALSDVNFPNNDWKDLVDIDSFVDFIMINEIVRNTELNHPKSTYICSSGGIIKMSHLWDFDWAFGLGANKSVYVSTAKGRYKGGWFFSRLFLDSEFFAKYKTRWLEKYNDIKSISAFIDLMYNKLRLSAELNSDRWYTVNYGEEINKLKTWWNNRIDYLDSEIRGN